MINWRVSLICGTVLLVGCCTKDVQFDNRAAWDLSKVQVERVPAYRLKGVEFGDNGNTAQIVDGRSGFQSEEWAHVGPWPSSIFINHQNDFVWRIRWTGPSDGNQGYMAQGGLVGIPPEGVELDGWFDAAFGRLGLDDQQIATALGLEQLVREQNERAARNSTAARITRIEVDAHQTSFPDLPIAPGDQFLVIAEDNASRRTIQFEHPVGPLVWQFRLYESGTHDVPKFSGLELRHDANLAEATEAYQRLFHSDALTESKSGVVTQILNKVTVVGVSTGDRTVSVHCRSSVDTLRWIPEMRLRDALRYTLQDGTDTEIRSVKLMRRERGSATYNIYRLLASPASGAVAVSENDADCEFKAVSIGLLPDDVVIIGDRLSARAKKRILKQLCGE